MSYGDSTVGYEVRTNAAACAPDAETVERFADEKSARRRAREHAEWLGGERVWLVRVESLAF